MSDPYIILVTPQLAENIGMSARAMMNCGLYDMRLVAPLQSHLSEKAIAASSGAEEILHNAKVFATTTEAIADCQQVLATTARRRDMIKTVHTAEAAAKLVFASEIQTGILFGPERTGLHNDDVALADAIIEIPLNPRHCSLNLSQAVLLVGYEYYKQQVNVPESRLITNKTEVANKEKVLKFLSFLEEELEKSGCFKLEDKRQHMVINLNNIFQRSQMTEQEINSLYNVVNYLTHKKF